jgi:hypothetical protein
MLIELAGSTILPLYIIEKLCLMHRYQGVFVLDAFKGRLTWNVRTVIHAVNTDPVIPAGMNS